MFLCYFRDVPKPSKLSQTKVDLSGGASSDGTPRAADRSSSRYELVQRVGDGATSSVWLAQGTGGERIALKIGRSLAEAEQLASEALHASLALSPRLPELIDLGLAQVDAHQALPVAPGTQAAEALPFLALRWVEGDLLQAVMETAEDSLSLALAVARDVGEALADLHGLGLCHGDVKPANIVLDPTGRLALLDLGLVAPAGAVALRGATPRYLGRGDRRLGDGRARDLLALGVVLTEIALPAVRRATEPLLQAREQGAPIPLSRITEALLAPEPGARPSARWVCDMATALSADPLGDGAGQRERDRRSLRAGYLRLRRREVLGAQQVAGDVAPWLHEAVVVAQQARGMCRDAGIAVPAALSAPASGQLGPLTADQRKRWLAGVVGGAALDWPSEPLAEVDEPTLVTALEQLASRRRPLLWSLGDLEAALGATTDHPLNDLAQPSIAIDGDRSLSAEDATVLTLAVSQLPLNAGAAELVEQLAAKMPRPLLIATADALRLAGHLGRARSLVLGQPGGGGIAAEVLRRAGDSEQARAIAEQQIAEGSDLGHRCRACLALMHLDAGEIDEAARRVSGHCSAATAEIDARVAIARDDRTAALGHAQRGRALATTPEAQARLAGVEAYVLQLSHGSGARERFRDAVGHAVRAGAVLEEATYRTGEASACVDLGELEAAVDTATRAALLWEDVLARPAMAARAWLARAGAYAAIDARHEAVYAARHALHRAEISDDPQAAAYALWAIADACSAGDTDAVTAAERAAELIGPQLNDDGLRAAARLQRHAPTSLTEPRRRAADEAARGSTGLSAFARLDWWAARAETLTARSAGHPVDEADGPRVLTELSSLAEADAPVWTRGKAMDAACRLAAALGDTETLPRLDAARRRAASPVIAATTGPMAEAARACHWLGRHRAADVLAVDVEQALDLQKLVRTLSERRNLRALLDQVIDVLLLWTGAERGLLLMTEPSGELLPRSARNLSHDDLTGDQLTVSSSLAQRALESGEPVVAVDAMEELSRNYASVHALKLRSVLVLPLVAHGEVLGVAYLDDRIRRGAFGDKEIRWAQTVAPLAALAIADARAQVSLRHAVRQAEQASHQLEQNLARKETALDVAERELARAVGSQDTRFRYDDIVGESEPLRRLLELVDRVAASDVPALLRGESGSGKELIARAIHRGSPRANQVFVGESCGALPETLLESALFGHVKGAFTGAHRPRVGLFEAADAGTLFLDEIGEMSLAMQTKLLRVLEDSIVRPVGSTRSRKVDVRIIAATHRDLEQMVAEGAFREDLYYRINVITIQIPPLRERASDIPLLVDHLIAKHAPGRRAKLTAAARQRLMGHPWPGNVRQLENEVRRALLLSDHQIDVEHLSIPDQSDQRDVDLGLNVRARIDRLETELVGHALGRTGGNQTQAAKLLGLSRYGLHKMMKRLGLSAR